MYFDLVFRFSFHVRNGDLLSDCMILVWGFNRRCLTFPKLTYNSEQTLINFLINSPKSVEIIRITCPFGSTLKCYIK